MSQTLGWFALQAAPTADSASRWLAAALPLILGIVVFRMAAGAVIGSVVRVLRGPITVSCILVAVLLALGILDLPTVEHGLVRCIVALYEILRDAAAATIGAARSSPS